MNTKEFQQNINKIIKARKIQKQNIEASSLGLEEEQETISKHQKPLITVIEDRNKELQLAIQQQNVVRPVHVQNVPAIERPANEERRIVKPQRITPKKRKTQEETKQQDEQSLEEDDNDIYQDASMVDLSQEEEKAKKTPKWVQTFYQNYYKIDRQRQTPYEVNMKDGSLGTNGNLDIAQLLNKNVLHITVNKTPLYIHESKITEGLIALVLLPYNNIREANEKQFTITKVDVETYFSIMQQVGYTPSNANKYIQFIKPFVKPKEEKVKKTGSGVINNNEKAKTCCVSELHSKLPILIGSLRAGNTSQELRKDIRETLDQLLNANEIPPNVHRKFYTKFNL